MFLPDGVLIGTDGRELTGAEVGESRAKYLPKYTMERTGDAVDNGDGTYSFKVEWTTAVGVDKRILEISIDGDRVWMVERIDTDQG